MTAVPHYVLVLRCPDRRGIVAAVASHLADNGFLIAESHQYQDERSGTFFMRVAFYPESDNPRREADIRADFGPVADAFAMDWELHDRAHRTRTLIAVSRFGHCLHDLVNRWRGGLLPIDIAGVVSNHDDLRSFTEWSGIPYHHLPIVAGDKAAQEQRIMALVEEQGVELVVLARYMQILSPRLCAFLAGRCINIHHSFLPSFKGAKPYHQAHERGVKIIGATAHYVTTDLDEGPIIEQDVRRVSHHRTPDELVAMGQEVECSVLGRAVRWQADHRVLTNGQRTVVFD